MTVVVPCYQQVRYIGQCLSSILIQQTNFEIEVLVGDDGSTDGTREICLDYAKNHPLQVKLLLRDRSEYNPGHPPGRDNLIALLNAARGRFIARCDGDDYWTDPLKLQQQVDLLEARPDAAGCFNLVQVIHEPGGKLGQIYGDHGSKLSFQLEDTITELAVCHPSGFIYRHSALPVLPGWLGRVASADISMYTLVAHAGVILCLPSLMGMYRKHTGGITTTALHNGTEYHLQRILLWLLLDLHFDLIHTVRCEQLFKVHWKGIVQQTTPRVRIGYLGRLVREVPSWFLRKPHFFLQRVLETLKR